MRDKNTHELIGMEAKPGVYVAMKVDSSDRMKVLDFCENILHLNMENSASPYSNVKEQMHATLLAAKDAKHHDKDTVERCVTVSEFDAKGTHWEIFESPNTGKKCLVLKLECPEMKEYHERLKKETGLMHTFNIFNLHISVHYNYNGEIPKEIPKFAIKFRGVYTKPYHYRINSEAEMSDMEKVRNSAVATEESTMALLSKAAIGDRIKESKSSVQQERGAKLRC